MTRTHDYNYVLSVREGDDQILAQFNEALDKTRLAGYIVQDKAHPDQFSSLVHSMRGGGLYEDTIEEELHALALQFPNLKLHFTAEDLDDRGHGYELKLQGDLYQRADIVTELTDFCPPIPFEQRAEARMTELQRTAKVQELLQTITKQTDYDLLYAQKQALLKAFETGAQVPKEALDGLIHFLDHVGDLGEVLGLFRYEGIDPPFPMQPDYEKKEYTFEPEQRKIHIFCEEFEGDNGIREFTVHAVSEDEESLQHLLKAKVDKDEYGYFAEKGVDESYENYAKTNYDEGFVEYYILEENVLSPEQAKALLNEPSYQDTYQYPDNLRDILLSDISRRGEETGFINLDVNKIVDTILNDEVFKAMFKTSWWGDQEHIDETNQTVQRLCISAFHSHLSELQDKDPNWFVTIGALKPFICPDNLSDILHDSYYDVCRDYHLPVSNIREEIASIMRDPRFQSLFEGIKDISHLEEGMDVYQETIWSCYDFVQDKLIPEKDIAVKQPRLSDILADARKRERSEKDTGKAPSEKGPSEPTR